MVGVYVGRERGGDKGYHEAKRLERDARRLQDEGKVHHHDAPSVTRCAWLRRLPLAPLVTLPKLYFRWAQLVGDPCRIRAKKST